MKDMQKVQEMWLLRFFHGFQKRYTLWSFVSESPVYHVFKSKQWKHHGGGGQISRDVKKKKVYAIYIISQKSLNIKYFLQNKGQGNCDVPC